MIKEYFKKRAYKQKLFDEAMKYVEEQERRRLEYEAIVEPELNYKVIQDLINRALRGVVAEIVTKHGDRIILRREEAFDQLEKVRMDEIGAERRASW